MDTNEPKAEQSGCGCDSSSGGDIPCTPGGKRNWRTILFVVAVVSAGAVAAHSVLTNGSNGGCPISSLCSLDKGGGQACAIEKGDGQAGSTVAACSLEKGSGESCPMNAACPMGQECSQDAPCPSMGSCTSQKPTCPMSSGQEEAAGCCPATTPAEPAPQPGPAGCCPGSAPAEPAPQSPATGCCPASGS